MIIISYNNIRKAPLKPGYHEGDDADEENVRDAALLIEATLMLPERDGSVDCARRLRRGSA